MSSLLIITTVPATIRSFLLPFARHFRAQGWKVDGMAHGLSSLPECTAELDEVWDVEWSRNPLDLSNLIKAPAVIRKVVEEKGYNLIHVHTPVAAFVTRLALRNFRPSGRPRVIYTAHGFHFYRGGPSVQNAVFLQLEKVAGRWTDYLVVMNQEDYDAARRWKIVPTERIVCMPGIGIDTQQYAPEAIDNSSILQVRIELGLPQESPLFTMIAEFNKGKRHADALRALARCRNRQVHLAFAGTGPLTAPMKELATELGISDRTHFLGFRQDIPELIRASVCTVLPSEREGLPRSVMESLAMGVPVIGADTRGIRDLLKEGSGLIVPVGDINGLARAMERILSNPDKATEMGRNGRERMRAYDISNILKYHEALYSTAISLESP